jgi:Tfp pilus assembly protein PilX
MRKQTGFVLIVVLIFLQICVVLGVCALESSWIENKMAQMAWQKHIQLGLSEQILRLIEQNLQTQAPACLIARSIANDISSQPISWWEQQSCAGNFQSFQYYYVVEYLGEDSCAHIRQRRGVAAEYYRITTLISNRDKTQVALLQSHVVKPGNGSDECDGGMHQVEIGRQSWYRLI